MTKTKTRMDKLEQVIIRDPFDNEIGVVTTNKDEVIVVLREGYSSLVDIKAVK